jgi:hypothetical protein
VGWVTWGFGFAHEMNNQAKAALLAFMGSVLKSMLKSQPSIPQKAA